MVSMTDTLPANNEFLDTSSAEEYYDSLKNTPRDTSTLELKRQKIYNRFIVDNKLSTPQYDTLIDLNYDGSQDYIIGYYGQSGTGIKNKVEVYLLNETSGIYILDDQLSGLINPTFYISRKKITSFYLAHGGGGGDQLEWIGNKWVSSMEFYVKNKSENSKWEIYYPLSKRKKVLSIPYQFIPPKDILETNIKY